MEAPAVDAEVDDEEEQDHQQLQQGQSECHGGKDVSGRQYSMRPEQPHSGQGCSSATAPSSWLLQQASQAISRRTWKTKEVPTKMWKSTRCVSGR